jgi:hypothetical protein
MNAWQGIEDSAGFAAFERGYEPIRLFTQFFEDTFEFIRAAVAGRLADREAGAALVGLRISGPPVPRADGHPDYDDPGPDPANPNVVLTRVALFVPFLARVQSPTKGPETLQGALTSVVGNVNQPAGRVVRSWMEIDDLGQNRLMAPDTDRYHSRMLSVGSWLPSDYPPGSPEREAPRPTR